MTHKRKPLITQRTITPSGCEIFLTTIGKEKDYENKDILLFHITRDRMRRFYLLHFLIFRPAKQTRSV